MNSDQGAFLGGLFCRRVADGMAARGVGLRELCRGVGLDPSFFSKVLSGKRSPPAQERILRQIASFLGLDAAGLIVSAGRIPSEWRPLMDDAEVFWSAHSLITGRMRTAAPPRPRPRPRPPRVTEPRRGGLSEELL